MSEIFILAILSIAIVVVLTLGVWVLKHNPRDLVNIIFFLLMLCAILWNGALLVLWAVPIPPEDFNFWANAGAWGPSLFFGLLLYFSYIFPDGKNRPDAIWTSIIALGALIAFLTAWGEFLYVDTEGVYSIPEVGWGFFVFHTFSMVCLGLTGYNLTHKIRISSGRDKQAVTWVFSGFIAGVLIGVFFNAALPLLGYFHLSFIGPPLATIVMAAMVGYAIITYDLMEIKVAAKRAIFYSGIVVIITLLFGSLNYVSDLIESTGLSSPFWVEPFIFSILAVAVGAVVWKRTRESDRLRYEFITIVSHKFRTPLTRIKWSLTGLQEEKLSKKGKTQVEEIQSSSDHLIELVNLLITISRTDINSGLKAEPVSLSDTVKKVVNELKEQIKSKDINVSLSVEDGVMAYTDPNQLSFPVRVLLNNAISYTPEGGNVGVEVFYNENKGAILKVTDDGIGIGEYEKPYIFKMFFRGKEARLRDTEGAGVSLYASYQLAKAFGGTLSYRSEGTDRGSTFTLILPGYKEGEQEKDDR